MIYENKLIKHLRSEKLGAVGLERYENESNINPELLEFERVKPRMGTNVELTVHEIIRNIRAGI